MSLSLEFYHSPVYIMGSKFIYCINLVHVLKHIGSEPKLLGLVEPRS